MAIQVKACVEANVQVFPIPGPSAALTALVASGLPTNEFTFDLICGGSSDAIPTYEGYGYLSHTDIVCARCESDTTDSKKSTFQMSCSSRKEILELYVWLVHGMAVGFLSARGSLRQERLIAAAKESATQIFYVPPHKLCRVLDDFISVFGSASCGWQWLEFWRGTLDEAKAEFEVRKPRGELTLIVEGLPERACARRATEEELMVRLKALLDAGKSPSEATKLVVAETSARRNTVYSLALQISQRAK